MNLDLERVFQNQLFIPYDRIKNHRILTTRIQNTLIWHRLLPPPSDGIMGRFSVFALIQFQKILGITEQGLGHITAKALIETKPERLKALRQSTSQNFLNRLVAWMQCNNYQIFTEPEKINIMYVEGIDPDFTINANTPDYFNDLAIIFDFTRHNGILRPRILGKWVATNDPGKYYTDRPLNPRGALHHNGQDTAWKVGVHKDHEALVQCDYITYTRDTDRNFITLGDTIERGKYNGANCHGSRFNRLGKVYRSSAGCKVVRSMRCQQEYMAVAKSDRDYQSDRDFVYTVGTVEGTELLDISSPVPETNIRKVNERDIELVAKTIWGEARGESYSGKVAVAHTIHNRYLISKATAHKDWWGNTISEIVLKPYQFSCHNRNDPNYHKIAKLSQSDPHYSEALKIARAVLNKEIPDNTGGATHYFAYKLVRPTWAAALIKTARIGNHDFYR